MRTSINSATFVLTRARLLVSNCYCWQVCNPFMIPVCEAFKLQRIFQFLTLVDFLYPGASCGFKPAHLRETDLGKERGEGEGDEEKSLAQ